MGVRAGWHAELAAELIGCWEGLWQRGLSSQVVVVAVPSGWGRSTVLDWLAEAAARDDAPVTLVARVNGRELPDGAGLQAAALRECLAGVTERHRVAELLGMDRLGGVTQMGLGVGGLFVSGLAAAVGFLVVGAAVGAAGKAWDDSPAGQDGAVARAARAVAAESAAVPVVVIIDDADCLDQDLALVLIENLAARRDGHVLTVVAADPGSGLRAALTARARMGITEGLVRVAGTDPDMGHEARVVLARELCPGLPGAAARRIAQGTATFKEVFAVASSPRLAEVLDDQDQAEVQAAVAAVLAAQPPAAVPSQEAVVIAWAGGLLSAGQAGLALGVLGAQRADSADRDVLRWEGLERLESPASPRLAVQAAALAPSQRQAMAAALLEEALAIAEDPSHSLVERVVAVQAAHRVRGDLADRSRLPRVQRALAAGLEVLGEPGAALQVAVTALEEWDGGHAGDRDWLSAAVLRLSRLAPESDLPAGAAELVDEAIASGSATGLEARIWAAIGLLADEGQREAALTLIDQGAADLDRYAAALGDAGNRWRLLLAFHAGRAGHPAVAQRVLAPLLASRDPGQEDAARVVLHAIRGPGADTRLQNVLLEAELATLPPSADDDRLRIHHVLAANHWTLGEYRQAIAHGLRELDLCQRIHGPDHPDTLAIRHHIAAWTGMCGDQAEALRLSQVLLPDQERVLGRYHPAALGTRGNIATQTGLLGEPARALRLFRALLPDAKRVLGPRDPDTLAVRSDVAYWTGECGDQAEGLREFRALLPDQERVLGPYHPWTLGTRSNIAARVGTGGNPAKALRLFRALLPDEERVFGPNHPRTLNTRAHIARWAGTCGDKASALRLYRALLPEVERVLGPNHPSTITTRNNITHLTQMKDE